MCLYFLHMERDFLGLKSSKNGGRTVKEEAADCSKDSGKDFSRYFTEFPASRVYISVVVFILQLVEFEA